MEIIAYTDGSSLGNPGPGGYGLVMMVVEKKYKKEFSEGFRITTNNRMELLAVIVALEKLKEPNQSISIYTDSKYVCDSVVKGWVFNWEKKQFKGKKNVDLWKKFLRLYRKHNVKFHWVKGHAGNIWNEKADQLAVKAANLPKDQLKIDQGFENPIDDTSLF